MTAHILKGHNISRIYLVFNWSEATYISYTFSVCQNVLTHLGSWKKTNLDLSTGISKEYCILTLFHTVVLSMLNCIATNSLYKKTKGVFGQLRSRFVSARPHTAGLSKKFKQMDSVEIFAHPPFSPNAAPSDYGLFCSVTHFLCNQQFNTFDEVGEACLHLLWFQASELVSGIQMLADH